MQGSGSHVQFLGTRELGHVAAGGVLPQDFQGKYKGGLELRFKTSDVSCIAQVPWKVAVMTMVDQR
jgi:hypothetical protein